MKKIMNDADAINLIQYLYNGGPNTEETWDDLLISLENYQPGISNVIMKSKKLFPPEEALRIAREKNKPIIL
jgi:hypothetical protein